ncbi:sensor histidine kinase [Candidatus Nitrospira nitrificans]|uniref:histidine kinase n=1 Tax=Candidatus Nitrospira nitrificans TaxID=1742973 RepID=A0A0S4L9Z1_9BACT|nr:HAMP domain-containing sensor histidine kinase [Candidatus Nitrospira nitrificans]CUS32699.1 putative Histidine kinase [Candidatus Nitrospira nitrificans]
MFEVLTPRRSLFSFALRTKLVLSMSVILVVACLVLGWLFIHQQVRSVAEGLRQSGTLLAQHLAHMGRLSLVAGDTQRLSHLVQEILAVDPVAYAAVLSSGGELQTGFGKGMWAEQFSVQPSGRRQFSLTSVTWPPRLHTDSDAPLISAVQLKDDRPLLRHNIEFTLEELLSVAGGFELPIVYDIIVRVPQRPFMTPRDPALSLTLDERGDGPLAGEIQRALAPALVQVGLSTSRLQHVLRQLLWQAAAITISIMAAGLLMALLLARRITTPLRELTQAATQLTAGETVPPVAGRTGDEIGTLTGVFNAMAMTLQAREHELRELTHTLEDRIVTRTQELVAANAKLQELDRRKSFFVSTASHELRTPLTSMKVHLANVQDGIDGTVTDDQRRSLARVEANLSRLQKLIDELLDLSTIEMGQASLRPEPVALGNVIAKAVEDLHPLASERRVSIVISLPSDLPSVSGDPNKLHQIILNLIHNAIKFSPPHSTVDVEIASRRGREIQISVRDVGPGLAPEEIEKVFQPFYRAAATPKQAKGAGLGLTIAKLLVELHHSRLEVETTLGKGSCFYFTLQPAVSKQELPLLQYAPIAHAPGA